MLLGSLLLVLAPSCSQGGRSAGDARAPGSDLLAVVAGRLVDVYGLVTGAQGARIELFETDVIVGPDIRDERPAGRDLRDDEITYDFFGSDPDTLRPRLLITREIGSQGFREAFDRLDARALRVAPAFAGQDTRLVPFTTVPRNAALRLDFARDLGVSDDFFVVRDQQGAIVGVRNEEAVQLLEIRGDPTQGGPGAFRVVPARVVPKGSSLVVDPVLLGSEARAYNAPSNARGMPASGNQTDANIRLALAMEGPLRISGIRERRESLVGPNNSGMRSILRDFRSGNRGDDTFHVSGGFLRDPIPPRVVGKMVMRLVRVESAGPDLQVVTVYKAGVQHEIDRGDVLELHADNSGTPVAVTEVVRDPDDDRGAPSVQFVQARVRSAAGFAPHDPSRRPDFPTDPGLLEKWLMEHAPKVVLSAEFTGDKDHPKYFVDFVPQPVPDPGRLFTEPNEHVSPFAGVIIRFSKPVDLGLLSAYDNFILSTSEDPEQVLDPQEGTPRLIAARVFDDDGTQTAIRAQPLQGFYLDSSMRSANLPYFLHVVGGEGGIKDLSGNPVDFQNPSRIQESFTVPFTLDVRNTTGGRPMFPDNLAVSVVRRFLDPNEDEQSEFDDWFGAVVLEGGRVHGRPTGRVSRVVDDRNQLGSPPSGHPLQYCGTGETHTNTAGNVFGAPIQNPMNPLGARVQNAWREIDLSLSRTDPFDFNLDVEQMHWAPHTSQTITFDEFDRTSLFLGHAERRPASCTRTTGGAVRLYLNSGLRPNFRDNFVRNLRPDRQVETRPDPFPAYVDKPQRVLASLVFHEPTGVNRFMPLPAFERRGADQPYFTFRDERVKEQGGGDGDPRVLSPFALGYWDNAANQPVEVDGRVGAIALPLLADFWYYPDSPDLPVGNPFLATGFNGWQVGLASTATPNPYWRIFSGGGYRQPGFPTGDKVFVDPSTQTNATGGFTPGGTPTPGNDPVVYWTQVDFLKRLSVMTYGFVDLTDPHRAVAHNFQDPRLGPYPALRSDLLPVFDVAMDPPPSGQPAGTRLTPEFRVANVASPEADFGHNPLVAGDAHVRVNYNPSSRRFAYPHRISAISDYTSDPSELHRPLFLSRFHMAPAEARWMNWRLIFENNIDAAGSVTPHLDSFAISWRIEERN